jgi:hypothetical protein
MRLFRGLTCLVAGMLLGSVLYAAEDTSWQNDFKKPTPQEALSFLKSLPPVARMHVQGYWLQQFKDFTAQDLKTCKALQPGGHIQDPRSLKKTNTPHLYLYPWQWKYFTVFDGLETFQVMHDLEGMDDSCFFYLGQLPPRTMTKIDVAIAGKTTGEGVKYLANLNNLKSLTIKDSRDLTDVALVNAGGIPSLEYLDVNGCPAITGSGVEALAKLTHLKVLLIGGTSLSDATLPNFKSLSVEELDLSDYVEPWIVKYRGGGAHRFTVTFDGLKNLLTPKENLPNLKRLLLKKTSITAAQKDELAKLRPGLEVK